MAKQFVNAELVEVAEGDKVIRVALFDIFDGGQLICEVRNDFLQLQENVRVNTQRMFDALSDEMKKSVMVKLSDKASSLVNIAIRDMLQSVYKEHRCYTESSCLFSPPSSLGQDDEDE